MDQLTPEAFVSPINHGSLSEQSGKWVCQKSGAKFPLIAGVPCLLPDADRALIEWRMRAQGLIQHYEKAIADLKEELRAPSLRTSTRSRLEKTRAMTIAHVEFLRATFEPLKLNQKGAQPSAEALGYKLPPSQAIQGYFPNLIRDWASESGENEAGFLLLKEAWGESYAERTLVLGAGACRLAFDLHSSGLSKQTVCADLNPLLFLVARRILAGETLKLVHFPTAPKNNEAASGVLRVAKAPKATRTEGFSQVFADVYYLPFADESVDTVVTPWLIDILPQRFEYLVQEINRVLKPGGTWINSGSLNFTLRRWSDSVSPEEAIEIASENGFKQEMFFQRAVPYLHTAEDAHQRTETVTTFRLKKTHKAPLSQQAPLSPEWLADISVAIPKEMTDQNEVAFFDSQAFLIAHIDGKRSAKDLALLLSQRYGLAADESLDAVVSFLSRRASTRAFRS